MQSKTRIHYILVNTLRLNLYVKTVRFSTEVPLEMMIQLHVFQGIVLFITTKKLLLLMKTLALLNLFLSIKIYFALWISGLDKNMKVFTESIFFKSAWKWQSKQTQKFPLMLFKQPFIMMEKLNLFMLLKVTQTL